jgi:hypothetical protein
MATPSRHSYLRHIRALWRYQVWTRWFGGAWAVLGVFTFFRDEILQPTDEQRWRVINMIPHLPLAWWLFGFAMIFTAGIFEASFRLSRELHDEISSLIDEKKSVSGPNTSPDPLSINFFNDNRHNIVKLFPGGTVQRQIRLSVKNGGNGWLSNCELRIEDASPRVFDVPYLLERGFSLQRGENRYCLFLYFDEKYPDGRTGVKALLPFLGGGVFYRAQGFASERVTFSLLASSDDPVTSTRATFLAFIKEGQLCVEKL